MELSLIVAFDENLGIGKNNDLPWKLLKEMQYFSSSRCRSHLLAMRLLEQAYAAQATSHV